jgi:3-phenylpropionate/trans-cinnamate dioxygenase ferredoxin subunit
MMPSYPIATVREVPPGSRRIVELGGRSIGIFNFGGRFFAVRNRCPHQAGPLCEGSVAGSLESGSPGEYRFDGSTPYIRCPWHGWEFDLATGRSWFDPRGVRVRTYPVTLESPPEGRPGVAGSTALRQGPFRAEIYPVSVEDDVVIVHIGRPSTGLGESEAPAEPTNTPEVPRER